MTLSVSMDIFTLTRITEMALNQVFRGKIQPKLFNLSFPFREIISSWHQAFAFIAQQKCCLTTVYKLKYGLWNSGDHLVWGFAFVFVSKRCFSFKQEAFVHSQIYHIHAQMSKHIRRKSEMLKQQTRSLQLTFWETNGYFVHPFFSFSLSMKFNDWFTEGIYSMRVQANACSLDYKLPKSSLLKINLMCYYNKICLSKVTRNCQAFLSRIFYFITNLLVLNASREK